MTQWCLIWLNTWLAFFFSWFSSVQLLGCVQLFVTLWIAARQGSLSITNSRSLLKLMSIELVLPSSHLILCRPLLLLPPIPPSIRSFPVSQLFAWGGQTTGVSAAASVLPMNTQDWFPLEWTGWISLESRGLSRILQHHSSKASNLWCSAFFTVQLSNPNTTTGKTIALIRPTFVGKRLIVHKKTLLRTSCKEVVWISEKSFQSEDSNIRCSVFPSSNLELQAKQYKRLF